MIVLDATVLVYAVGADHPFRAPCRDPVQAIDDRRIETTTTVEVIQELVHVRGRRQARDDAAAVGRDYADLLAPLLTVSGDDLAEGWRRMHALSDSAPSTQFSQRRPRDMVQALWSRPTRRSPTPKSATSYPTWRGSLPSS